MDAAAVSGNVLLHGSDLNLSEVFRRVGMFPTQGIDAIYAYPPEAVLGKA